MMAPDDKPPPRPAHDAVAAALLRVAGGEAFLADLQPDETDHTLQRVCTVSGWQLAIWWHRGTMGPLHAATDPEGLQWCYGCGRWPGWDAGPDAVVLDPIRHLLTTDQRDQLREVLLAAVCWPPPPPLPMPPVAPLPAWTDEELLNLIPS
jgi:hypothetical protein